MSNRPAGSNVTHSSVEDLAREIFEISKITWATGHRSKIVLAYDLTETEFLTLDALQQNECLTVGDLQRRVAVLPAQMSRIIKNLETKYDQALVSCAINSTDKRKIDVRITDAGCTAADAFRQANIKETLEAVKILPPADIEELTRIARTIRTVLTSRQM